MDTSQRGHTGIVVLNAGTSTASSTRRLALLVADAAAPQLGDPVTVLDLGPLAVDIAHSIVDGVRTPALDQAQQLLHNASAIIVGTPVYQAGISGLLKSFVDILDPTALADIPTALTATGGSVRHALVIDVHLRSLFAYMHAFVAPTGIFAAPGDWVNPDLATRVASLAAELNTLALARYGQAKVSVLAMAS